MEKSQEQVVGIFQLLAIVIAASAQIVVAVMWWQALS